MSRVPRIVVDPRQPQSVVDHLGRVQTVVDGKLEFGSPQDPTDPQSTSLADGATHNGTLQNLLGSWVEASVTALDTAVRFTHNLGVPVITGFPNVRWLVFALQHDGTQQNVWEDLRVPMTATTVGGAKDPGLITFNGGNLKVWGFAAGGQDEELFFECQIPHSYKEGTDILPHVHWCPIDANTGNVKWGIEYQWANPGSAFPVSATLESFTAVSGGATGTAWLHSITALGTISGAGKNISSMLVCRVYREQSDAVNDTYASDAALLELDFHFQADSAGSIAEFSKDPFGQSQAPVSITYTAGDAINPNYIDLRFHAAPNRLVDGDHPVKVTLFFVPAVR